MSGQCVVIIDDDTWTSEHYVRILKKNGYRTQRASNAIEGLELIDRVQPDAVILDMFMPGPNGMVLLHEFASHEDLSRIPIIISTNNAGEISEEHLKRYGVREMLDKTTMQPEDIVRAVRRVL